MAIERNTQHGNGSKERDIHQLPASFGIALVHAPNDGSCQQNDIDNHTRIERHAQGVDKQQLKPSAYLHHTRHNAVEHYSHQYGRTRQSKQTTFQIGIRVLLIIINQYNRGDTKQVQQVNPDTQPRKVSNQNQPTVAMRLVGHILPFQDEPEHHGGKQAGESIHFTFHGTIPEGITPGIRQGTHQTGPHDGNQLADGHLRIVGTHQLLHQMRNAPEQEQDTSGTHQGIHDVYPISHLRRVAGKLTEKIGYEHKERSTGRVSHFEFISGSNEFRAIPKAGRRLHGCTISNGRNQESEPSGQIVH